MSGARVALDVGLARIGVARCDGEQLLVSPVETIQQGPTSFDRVIEICQDFETAAIYVGLPISLTGRNTASTVMARDYAVQLARRIEIPIHLVDERLSTATAAGQLRDSGRSAKKSKSVIDQAAAIVILEQALAIEKQSGKLAGEAIGVEL